MIVTVYTGLFYMLNCAKDSGPKAMTGKNWVSPINILKNSQYAKNQKKKLGPAKVWCLSQSLIGAVFF